MLKGKVVVITGGAGLLGRAFVNVVVKNQGVAIIADICPENAIKAKSSFSVEEQKNIDIVELDITNSTSILAAIDYLDITYQKIDALVNNAYPRNKNYGKHFFDVEYEDFNENVGLHLGGYFNTSKLFSKYFVKQGSGNIINVSSIYGVVAPKFEIYDGTLMTVPVEYAVIKSGVIHLTKYMAKYFKDKNIRVNALSLGGILDGQPKSFLIKYRDNCLNKGMLNGKDIDGTLLYLLSQMSQYVNGQNIVVDDGFTL
jgi:NAD(P)-dependent dehydrogenase (short-subunit alcohol dehydrogenase family)